jgi:RNA polymerase sigma-70 factor (sigma-E family)
LLTVDWQAAEDLVQDVLIKVASRWERICKTGDPEPYVRQAIYRRAVDAWRVRRSRSQVIPEPQPVPDSSETTAVRLTLRAALARLTARQRAVLVLRFYQDLTEVQAAAVLGCSANTVKTQCRLALPRIKESSPELAEAFDRASTSAGEMEVRTR